MLHPEALDDFWADLAKCSSAERLCEAAAAQGMLGHLHKTVVTEAAAEADRPLVKCLADLQRAATVRSLRQTALLLQVLDSLQEQGIKAMPYKGPAWAMSLYGDVAMRTWSDLDLLVGHDDVVAARETLIRGGFTDANPFNEKIARRRRGSLGQIALTHPDKHAHVELHWEVTMGISSRSLRPESVFARAEQVQLLGTAVPCPSRHDRFLITCLEYGRDRWDTVEKLLSLGVQIRQVGASEWEDLLGEAREVGCLRRVCVGAHHVCSALGMEVVPAVDERLASDWVGRSLARTLRPSLPSKEAAVGSRQELAHLWWTFASEDRLASSMGHALRRLFQSGPEDWATYSLPRCLAWLYGPLRPFRLVTKWARRLTRVGGMEGSGGAEGV